MTGSPIRPAYEGEATQRVGQQLAAQIIYEVALPVFTALYHEHIALEETVVYPAARRHRDALQAGESARQT